MEWIKRLTCLVVHVVIGQVTYSFLPLNSVVLQSLKNVHEGGNLFLPSPGISKQATNTLHLATNLYLVKGRSPTGQRLVLARQVCACPANRAQRLGLLFLFWEQGKHNPATQMLANRLDEPQIKLLQMCPLGQGSQSLWQVHECVSITKMWQN